MTLGSVMNWGGFGKPSIMSPIERYHSGSGGYWDHKSHGHGSYKSGGKGGGSGAALSALTLLAFLFLINVMQQSLQDNNATMSAGTATTALLLREDQKPVFLNSREESGRKSTKLDGFSSSISSSGNENYAKKGDTFGHN